MQTCAPHPALACWAVAHSCGRPPRRRSFPRESMMCAAAPPSVAVPHWSTAARVCTGGVCVRVAPGCQTRPSEAQTASATFRQGKTREMRTSCSALSSDRGSQLILLSPIRSLLTWPLTVQKACTRGAITTQPEFTGFSISRTFPRACCLHERSKPVYALTATNQT